MARVKLKIKCEECYSKFILNYDDENVESDPLFCPWCAEYFEKDKDLDDDYEDDE